MMNDEIKQAVEMGKLTEDAGSVLMELQPGAFCRHKSWGFGRVAEWQLLTGQIIVDFDTKKGHPMQAQYAVDTLEIIPPNYIEAQLRTNFDAIKKLSSEDPVNLVQQILQNKGGSATADQIQNLLVPALFTPATYKKWWESTKKKLKADGHFQIPSKKTEPFELLETPVAQHAGLIAKFRGARYLKDQVAALDQLMKSLDDFAHEVEELQSLAAQIEEVADKGKKLQAAQALELLLARDEILSRHQALRRGDSAPLVADILNAEQNNLPTLFTALPATKQKAALDVFEEAFGERWATRALKLMRESNARLVGDIYRLFAKKKQEGELKAALEKWISERSASSEILYWLCKDRGGPFKELFNHRLFGAVLSALEMDQLSETKKSMRLRDLMFDDKTLLADFFVDCDREIVRDAMRRLILTTVFDDLNRRSLLARIIKIYPELQSMIGGESVATHESLTVSWASLERRKKELDNIVNKLIPQNVRDIQTARSYGDLRENFEFKSAKEQQAVLARRKAELERMLTNARGTNFENPDTSVVSIGTVVSLTDLDANKEETYSLLGAWDSAPEQGLISYKAALGQALLGKAVGETAIVKTETGQQRTVRIDRIEPFTNLAILGELVDAAAA